MSLRADGPIKRDWWYLVRVGGALAFVLVNGVVLLVGWWTVGLCLWRAMQ